MLKQGNLIGVFCLDDDKTYYFDVKTPYEAMEKMLYKLNIAHYDPRAIIDKTPTNKCFYIEHNGKCYATLIS